MTLEENSVVKRDLHKLENNISMDSSKLISPTAPMFFPLVLLPCSYFKLSNSLDASMNVKEETSSISWSSPSSQNTGTKL